jgi:hypothetical protein
MSRTGRALVLVSIALLVGASLCALDAGEVAGIDLCGVVLLPSPSLMAMGPPELVGQVTLILVPVRPADTPDPPFPPPRS